MHESPSSTQLLSAVITFLNDIAPQLSAHSAFHARVSANALALVARETTLRGDSETRALELYTKLLGTSFDDLRQAEGTLCAAIRAGDITFETQGVLFSLRDIATAQLAIDQPTYSGLKS